MAKQDFSFLLGNPKAFSKHKAYWMAKFSAMAYSSDPSAELKNLGFDKIILFSKRGTFAYLAVHKKFAVLAKEGDKVRLVRFGDPNMRIRKSEPARRKSFRARHKCDEKKSKLTAGYWSCKKW